MEPIRAAIWKQTLTTEADQSYEWPAGSQVIHAEMQNGRPRLWFFVPNADAPLRQRRFVLLPTGGPSELFAHVTPQQHRGTFLLHGGEIVAHCFEVPEDEDMMARAERAEAIAREAVPA